jgi:hypothetical protein
VAPDQQVKAADRSQAGLPFRRQKLKLNREMDSTIFHFSAFNLQCRRGLAG